MREFLDKLSGYVRTFASPEHRAGPSVAFIQQTFGYPEEDVKVGFFLPPSMIVVLTWV